MICSSSLVARAVVVAGVLVFVAGGAYAQLFDFVRAARFGGPGNDRNVGFSDASGNLYLNGPIFPNTDLDPGPGVLIPASGALVYVLKIDPAGTLDYAATYSSGMSMSGVDGLSRLHLVGSFGGTQDVDPGPGTFNVVCPDSSCLVVSRLGSDGTFDFAVTLDSPNNLLRQFRTYADASGNHFIVGTFRGTVDFDPGAGVAEVTSVTSVAPASDGYILKLDADGNFEFVRTLGVTGGMTRPTAIVTDDAGLIHVVGQFDGTLDMDPGPGVVERTTEGTHSSFILTLDAAGDFQRVHTNFGTGSVSDTITQVTVDSAGSVYATGDQLGEVDFNPGFGDAVFPGMGDTDGFIQKLDPSGNFDWVRTFGNSGSDSLNGGPSVDEFGNVYACGFFEGYVDFDPGPGQRVLRSSGNPPGTNLSPFFVALSGTGDLRDVEAITSDAGGVMNVVAPGAPGELWLTGSFDGTADLDPTPGEQFESAVGAPDSFIVTLERNNAVYVDAPGIIREGDAVALHAPIGENFQWLKDGVPVVDDPPRVTGANTYMLRIAPVLEADAGVYRVQYEDGSKAVVVSEPYVLTVNPPGALPVTNAWAVWAVALVLVVLGTRLMARMVREQFS